MSFDVCWRSASAAATAGRVLPVAVSTSCVRSGEDEDDALRLIHIHGETVRGLNLMVGWAGAGWLVG
jgi:hypothetical protein